jgi:hypothetical protein
MSFVRYSVTNRDPLTSFHIRVRAVIVTCTRAITYRAGDWFDILTLRAHKKTDLD